MFALYSIKDNYFLMTNLTSLESAKHLRLTFTPFRNILVLEYDRSQKKQIAQYDGHGYRLKELLVPSNVINEQLKYAITQNKGTHDVKCKTQYFNKVPRIDSKKVQE
jgi:hypothetical protein